MRLMRSARREESFARAFARATDVQRRKPFVTGMSDIDRAHWVMEWKYHRHQRAGSAAILDCILCNRWGADLTVDLVKLDSCGANDKSRLGAAVVTFYHAE